MNAKLFLIVEDHPVMAEMICKSLKQLEPTAHCIIAENTGQAEERLKLETPDLITVDLMFKKIGGRNSGQPGLDFLEYIFEQYSQLNILVYSTEPSLLKPIIEQAPSHQGSFVVVDKQLPPKDFLKKARLLLDHQGIKLIPSYLTQKQLDSIKITDKERQILQLVCQDCLTDALIAKELKLSRKSIQNLMRKIRNKLNIFVDKSEQDLRILMCNKARDKTFI